MTAKPPAARQPPKPSDDDEEGANDSGTFGGRGGGAPGQKAYDWQILARLWRYIRPHWPLLFFSMLLLPLSAALQLAPPYLLKVVIDSAIVPRELSRLAPLAGLLIGVLVTEQLVLFGHTVLLQLCGQRAMHDLRVSAHRHLLGLRLSYFDRTPVGKVMTRVTNDVESIAEAFASGMVALVGDVLKLVGIIAIMLWLDTRLTLLTFSVLPVLLLVAIVFQRLLRASYRQVRSRLARINAMLQEQLSGMKVVQVFGREAAVQRDFATVNDDYRNVFKEAIKYDASLYALVEMLGSITVALVLWYGGIHVLKQNPGAAPTSISSTITFGLLVAFIDYAQRFFQPVRDLSAKYAVMQQAMAASERVFGLLDTDEPDAPSRPAPTPEESLATSAPPASTAKVELRDVVFRYGTAKEGSPLFDGLSLKVARGETVAVVGATGSGKSSLVRLLTRLYEIEEGGLYLDGVDVRDLPVAELRRRVVVLGQDVFLFAASVRDNITLGSQHSDEDVQRAVERVGLDRRLTLDHAVLERGQNLSLGERQLIVLARALLRDPEILVLDEATASVDPEAEELIQRGISELMRERTAIVIAHRLTTIEEADRVLVLHRGRLVEQGSHAELLAADGVYARLYRLQYV